MSYNNNITNSTVSLPVSPPPGSIMAYIGTSEPDGWVICNGQQRSNADGRYNNLIALTQTNPTGTGSYNSTTKVYTPPDYRGAFLRGAGTNATYNYIGHETVGEVQGQMISDHNHQADLVWVYGRQTQGGTDGNREFMTNDINNSQPSNKFGTSYANNVKGSVGGETRPFNFSINWIIKL